MTVEQITLDGGAVTLVDGKALTDRQQLVWDAVRAADGGVSEDEIGALVHATLKNPRYQHSATMRCQFCGRDGHAVLAAKALKTLVIRRRTGLWYPRNPADNARAPTRHSGLIATSEPDPTLNPFADL